MGKWLAVICCTIFLLVASTALIAATASEAPDNITLDGCSAKRSAVEFPHKLHEGTADCVACHHTQEGLTALPSRVATHATRTRPTRLHRTVRR